MLLLVHKAHETLTRYRFPHVGRLASPRHYSRIQDTVRAGYVWAADNDAYLAWDEGRYVRMLNDLEGTPGCLFVTAPDVVGDAEATFSLYLKWAQEILGRGLPLGFVGQDGATVATVPWNGLSALFIGGSTDWKLGAEAATLIKEAKTRGKWVHMGRVNSWQRMEYAKSVGVDSIDGTQLSMFTDTYLEQWSGYAQRPTQMNMSLANEETN